MHSGQDSAVAVPDYVLFDFIETKNKGPPARWGHTAVVVDHKLFIYGGEGSQAYGDLQIYEPGIGCIVLYPIGFEAAPKSWCVGLPVSVNLRSVAGCSHGMC